MSDDNDNRVTFFQVYETDENYVVDDFANSAYDEEAATCPECGGDCIIITCCDDMCVGMGHCIHGDGEEVCPVCHGEGII